MRQQAEQLSHAVEDVIAEAHFEEAMSAFESAQAWLDLVEGPDSPSGGLLLA